MASTKLQQQIEAAIAKDAEERERQEMDREQMIMAGLGLDKPGQEGVNAAIESLMITVGLGQDPVGTFRRLQAEAGPRGFTFAGRHVQPHQTLEDTLSRLPIGEMESGGLMARAANTSSLLNLHNLARKGAYFAPRTLAPDSELRAELKRRIEQEREDPDRSAVFKFLEARVIRAYENLRAVQRLLTGGN